MTNTSHMVNTLSIGHPLMHRLGGIPPEVQIELHQSYHHYLKIVTVKTEYVNLYPININSQLTNYERDTIPEVCRVVMNKTNCCCCCCCCCSTMIDGRFCFVFLFYECFHQLNSFFLSFYLHSLFLFPLLYHNTTTS